MKKKPILAALLTYAVLTPVATVAVAMMPPIWECDLAEWYGWQNSWHNERCYIALMEQGYQIDP